MTTNPDAAVDALLRLIDIPDPTAEDRVEALAVVQLVSEHLTPAPQAEGRPKPIDEAAAMRAKTTLEEPFPWLLRVRRRFVEAGGSPGAFDGAVNAYANNVVERRTPSATEGVSIQPWLDAERLSYEAVAPGATTVKPLETDAVTPPPVAPGATVSEEAAEAAWEWQREKVQPPWSRLDPAARAWVRGMIAAALPHLTPPAMEGATSIVTVEDAEAARLGTIALTAKNTPVAKYADGWRFVGSAIVDTDEVLVQSFAPLMIVHPRSATEGATGGEETVEKVARAMAMHDDYDGCFERVDEWNATPEDERYDDNYPGMDLEGCEWWRARARAGLAALPHLTPPAPSPSPSSVAARALSGEHVGRTVRLPDGTEGVLPAYHYAANSATVQIGVFNIPLAPSDVVEFVGGDDR